MSETVTTAPAGAYLLAEQVRQLCYLTMPREGAPGLSSPADVYEAIGGLLTAVQRMPQLFGQLSLWLGQQHAAGKVGHASGRDAGGYVNEVRQWLSVAEGDARQLAAVLNKVHNESAGLKAAAERQP